MEVYFNELSLTQANSVNEADYWVNTFVDVVTQFNKIDSKLAIRYSKPFLKEVELHENYSFINSLKNIQKDKLSLFLKLFSSSPIIYPCPESPDEDYSLVDDERIAIGLGYAYIHNSYSLSLISDELWQKQKIELLKTYIDNNQDSIEEERIIVDNISTSDNLNIFLEEIKQKNELLNFDMILNMRGIDLWNEKEKLFPNLIFCDGLKIYFEQLEITHREYKSVLTILNGINICFENKNLQANDYHNKLNNLPSKYSTESQTRKTNPNLNFRFICPDGEYRDFFEHYRYTPGAGRIHFYPDYTNKKCYIGYIGNKIK